MHKSRAVVIALAFGWLLPRAASPDVTPIGPELQANTFTAGSQDSAAVAAGGSGDFVVVWRSSNYFQQQDGSGPGIFARETIQRLKALTGSSAGSAPKATPWNKEGVPPVPPEVRPLVPVNTRRQHAQHSTSWEL